MGGGGGLAHYNEDCNITLDALLELNKITQIQRERRAVTLSRGRERGGGGLSHTKACCFLDAFSPTDECTLAEIASGWGLQVCGLHNDDCNSTSFSRSF